jgi:peroxiredoxin
MAIEVGEQAPDFELKDQHGTPVRLSSFRGAKNVVLVFYPLAFSGVCTGELCAIRDEFPESERDDVEVLTVSVDSTFAIRTWADAEHFQFGLLSDFWPHGAVACTVCSTPSAASRPGAHSSSTRTASCAGRSSTRSRRRAISPSIPRRSPRSASVAFLR